MKHPPDTDNNVLTQHRLPCETYPRRHRGGRPRHDPGANGNLIHVLGCSFCSTNDKFPREHWSVLGADVLCLALLLLVLLPLLP